MIPASELRDSLWGAWRLAHLDPSGIRWLNLSSDGFYRSFFAAVLIAPAYFLVAWVGSMPGPEPAATPPRSIIADVISYPLLWLVFPLLLAVAARPLGLGRQYAAGVIALNWAQVVIMAVVLPITLFALTGALGPFGALLYLSAYAASLFYTWFVLRTALETTGAIAAALTAGAEMLWLLVQHSIAAVF
jgi:hypothetical protein